jgi:hypothetical protein
MALGLEIGTRVEEREQATIGRKLVEIDREREFLRPEWLNDYWLLYYDGVEIFINEEPDDSGGQCYIYWDGRIHFNFEYDEYWEALLIGKRCMAHEVGHWVDRQNDYPSETDEFHEAVDLAAKVDWQIAHWPCLYENPCDGWGGYGELYADLFERQSIGDIPAVLWDWYLPYYYTESE